MLLLVAQSHWCGSGVPGAVWARCSSLHGRGPPKKLQRTTRGQILPRLEQVFRESRGPEGEAGIHALRISSSFHPSASDLWMPLEHVDVTSHRRAMSDPERNKARNARNLRANFFQESMKMSCPSSFRTSSLLWAKLWKVRRHPLVPPV